MSTASNSDGCKQMKWFKLTYCNKVEEDGPPYTMALQGDASWTVDDMWNRAHNYYDIGDIVMVTDLSNWHEKTFCK